MDSPAPEPVDLHPAGHAGAAAALDTSQLDDTTDAADITDQGDHADDAASTANDDDADHPHRPATAPMQKRRRVTRACDECRRKKIKCDGKQPCTHCTVYSYECTYDQPSNRRRNAAPQYIEGLETQLKRATALLSIVFPTLDLNDPSIDAHLQSGLLPQVPVGAVPPNASVQDPRLPPRRNDQARDEQHDSHLESMVKATGQLDLDEDGKWDYHGHSSGFSFMKRLQQQFGENFPGRSTSAPFVQKRRPSQVPESHSSDHPSPSETTSNLPSNSDLPSKKTARLLCDAALLDASAMMRVVHLPTFHKSLDNIYDVPPENYSHADHSFLPLLYVVLAMGTLFTKKPGDSAEAGYEAYFNEGFKYFKISRQLLDIADCRDIVSLQTVVYMIQFLQCTAKLSTCYAYVGIALRACLRMGMHRSFSANFSPIEAEIRKRLFWVVRRMDTYVGAMLGLPIFLQNEDVDQDLPTPVDDEYITETEILPMPNGDVSVMAASNAHAKLLIILQQICKYVYPIKGTQSGTQNSVTYSVSYSKIREIEKDLQQWQDNLPVALKPGGDAPYIITKIQQLLRMSFAHAQLLLYRPFLHYVSLTYQNKTIDQRAFACASACISVSRNIIHITAEMQKRGLLVGAYWFSMYTAFFAIISLIYFILENPDSPTSHELFRDAVEGRQVLARFAKRSLAANHCTMTLNTIFEKLPSDIVQVVPANDMLKGKRRRQESSPQSFPTRSNIMKQEEAGGRGPRRASTFPESIPNSKRTTSHTLPMSEAHLANLGVGPNFGLSAPNNSEYFESAPGLTPASTTPSVGGFSLQSTQQQIYPPGFPAPPTSAAFVGATSVNVPLSDVNAMMFPSADPFAYPNQPMTTFENNHPHDFKSEPSPTLPEMQFPVTNMDMKPQPTVYNSGGINLPMPRRNDQDVQLFGPMPMYLMHGTQQQGQGVVRGMPHPHNIGTMGHPQTGNTNLDDIFGGEEWANAFMDQGLGMGGNQAFPTNPPFVPGQNPNMHNWR